MICTIGVPQFNSEGASLLKRGIPGVYSICNSANSKRYVGSAICVYDRIYNHLWHLERETHKNRKLLNAWRKYTPSYFLIEILEIVAPDALLACEQIWIDRFDSVRAGYNINPKAGSNLGRSFDPIARGNMASGARSAMADPIIKARHREATLKAMSCPEVREKCRIAIKKRWGNPAARQLLITSRHSSENKAKASIAMSIAAKKRLQNPAARELAREQLRMGLETRWRREQ